MYPMAKRGSNAIATADAFAVAGVPRDTHAPGIYMLVRFEVVERPARTPGPGAQSTPIVQTSGPASVHQPDDPLGQAGAVVGLNADGDKGGKTPPFPKRQSRPRRRLTGRRHPGRPHEREFHITGTGPVAPAGVARVS